MKPCLVDVNVWMALLAPRHVHHEASDRWFAALAPSAGGMCRMVQLGVIRLLGNASVMGPDAIPAAQAWKILAQLMEDERLDFLPEPRGIEAVLPDLFSYPVPTGKLVGDAYLAAFAIASRRTMFTTDRGFRQFRGLDVEILG
jgi:toxin-antitoxin system PIN domain toxin